MGYNFEIGRSPKQLAETLVDIYNEQFGGKKRGRFRTARRSFRRLAQLPNLRDDYILEVSMWLKRAGLILVDLDANFLIMPATVAKGFRRVPLTLIEKYSGGTESEEVDDSEDEE